MPALSPTMTEGNIAKWQVKEGDRFAAGDVLLEIETDKATMDVEAQEDGILMKIMRGDSSKGVQVGARIAVIAEEGDDISTLELPPDESSRQQQSLPAAAAKPDPPASSPSPSPSSTPPASAPSNTRAPKQTYPLYPSVAHLLKKNGLDESAARDITPTGPNGRLLKGDVLAYLGKIDAATPAAVSARFNAASHLDLSNIKVAPAPAKKAAPAAPAAAEKASPPPPPSLVALPVSLEAVTSVQKKVHHTLGVFLPLTTFIERAADVANDDLPLPAGAAPPAPSADELFDQVLGLGSSGPKKAASSRGSYTPLVSALSQTRPLAAAPRKRKEMDIIDLLSGRAGLASGRGTAATAKEAAILSTGPNLFSLQVPRVEQKRAQVFLERLKLVLENEPGRLVL
ncbi:hypothetical protein B0T26DRAFT_720578 [Lasiosphaeria miniovina]|uniref:Pyruvate dehydrogenase protein x component n=1 Tax=Lasiosphaeria miniovina TaxID=1954250 RepID=A0AA40DQ54_9PEZI|nr:uncharacterized protein B0T26DRAFT_720578 [Lasiosphaeria miniovina]KAK0709147.1 hypothetical protein B0T26DRAFT_720578 [Lasiosphaeria miniovina]